MRTLGELQAELQQARASLQQMENARKEAALETGSSEVAQLQDAAADAAAAPVSDSTHEGTTGSDAVPLSSSAEALPIVSDTGVHLAEGDVSGAFAVPSTGANADVGTPDRKEVPAANNAATADYLMDDSSSITSSSPGVTSDPASSLARSLDEHTDGSHVSSTAPALSALSEGTQNAPMPPQQQQQYTADGALHHPGGAPPSHGHLPAGGEPGQALMDTSPSPSHSASHSAGAPPSHVGAPSSHQHHYQQQQQEPQVGGSVEGTAQEGRTGTGGGGGDGGAPVGQGATPAGRGVPDSMQASAMPTGGASMTSASLPSASSVGAASTSPASVAATTTTTTTAAQGEGEGGSGAAGGGGGFFSRFFGGSKRASSPPPAASASASAGGSAAMEQQPTGSQEGMRSSAGAAALEGAVPQGAGATATPLTAEVMLPGHVQGQGGADTVSAATPTSVAGSSSSHTTSPASDSFSAGTGTTASSSATPGLPSPLQQQQQQQQVFPPEGRLPHPTESMAASSPVVGRGTGAAGLPDQPPAAAAATAAAAGASEPFSPSHGHAGGPLSTGGDADDSKEEPSPVLTPPYEDTRQGGEEREKADESERTLHNQDALAGGQESRPAAEGGSAGMAALSPPTPASSVPHGQSQPQRSYQPQDPLRAAQPNDSAGSYQPQGTVGGGGAQDSAVLGQPPQQQQGQGQQAQWQVGVTADGGTTAHLPLSPSSAPSVSSVTEQDGHRHREREVQPGAYEGMGVSGTGTPSSEQSSLESAGSSTSEAEARHEHLTSTSWPGYPSGSAAESTAGGPTATPVPAAATDQGHAAGHWMPGSHHHQQQHQQQQYMHRNGSSETQPLPSTGQGSGRTGSPTSGSSGSGNESGTEGQGASQHPTLQGTLNTSLTSEVMTPAGGAYANASNTSSTTSTTAASASSGSGLCGEMASLYAEVLAQLTASGCAPPPSTPSVASVHQPTASNASAAACPPCTCAAAGGDVRFPHTLGSNASSSSLASKGAHATLEGGVPRTTGYVNSSSAFALNSTAATASCVCPPALAGKGAGHGGQVPPTLLPLLNASQAATTAALAAAWAVAQAETFLAGAWEELQPALGPSAVSVLQQGAGATGVSLNAALSSAKDLWHAQVSASDAPVGQALATLVSTFFRQRHAILALLAYGPEPGVSSLPLAPFPSGGADAGFLGVGEQQQQMQAAASDAQPLLPLLLRPWAKPVLDGSVTLAALLLLYVLLTLLWPLLDLAWGALTCRCLCPFRWASRGRRAGKGGALSHSDAAAGSLPAHLQGSGSERSPEGKKGPGGAALYTLPKGAPTTPLPIGRNTAGMVGGGEQHAGERRASTGAAPVPSLAPPAFMQVHSLNNNTSQVPTRAARTGSAASQPPSLPFSGSASMPPPTLSKGSSGSSTGSTTGVLPPAQQAQQAPPAAPQAAGPANNTKIPLAIPPHLAKKLMQQGQGGLSQSMVGPGSHAKGVGQAVQQGREGSNSASSADGPSSAPPMSMFMQPPSLAVGPGGAGAATSSGAGANGLAQGQGQGGPRAGSVGPRRSGPGPVMPLHSEPSSSYGPAQGSLPLSPSSATAGAGGGAGWGAAGPPWTGNAPAPVSPPLSPSNLHSQGQWGVAQGGGMAGLGPRDRASSTGQGSVGSTGGGGGTGGPTRGPPRAIQGPLFATPQPPRVAAAVTQAGPGVYPAGKMGGGQQAAVRQQA